MKWNVFGKTILFWVVAIILVIPVIISLLLGSGLGIIYVLVICVVAVSYMIYCNISEIIKLK